MVKNFAAKIRRFLISFKDVYVSQRSLLREICLKHNTIAEERSTQKTPVQ